MECYYHEGANAVGLCARCQKAACRQCLSDVGGTILCMSCIKQGIMEIAASNEKQVKKAKRAIIWSIVWTVLTATGTLAFMLLKAHLKENLTIIYSLILIYASWASYWGVPPIQRFFEKSPLNIVFIGFGSAAVIAYFYNVTLRLSFLLIGIFYGIFGGGIYLFTKTLYKAGYFHKS